MIRTSRIICTFLLAIAAPLMVAADGDTPMHRAKKTRSYVPPVPDPPQADTAPPTGEVLAEALLPGTTAAPTTTSNKLPRQMTDAYHVLLTRSIFSKDHNRPAIAKRTSAPTTLPTATVDATPSELAEANFVLKGVGIDDEQPTAFFEQASDKKMVRVHLGQNVSHGQISVITLDGIDYAAGEKSVHVNIGESLSGISTGISTTYSAATTQPSATQPTEKASAWIRKHHED